jgi:hypothetical protein
MNSLDPSQALSPPPKKNKSSQILWHAHHISTQVCSHVCTEVQHNNTMYCGVMAWGPSTQETPNTPSWAIYLAHFWAFFLGGALLLCTTWFCVELHYLIHFLMHVLQLSFFEYFFQMLCCCTLISNPIPLIKKCEYWPLA